MEKQKVRRFILCVLRVAYNPCEMIGTHYFTEMKRITSILVFCLLAGVVRSAEPTFGDLAVLLAKGYFGRYVGPEASLPECVVFLNQRGICFSLFDLIDPEKSVSREDLARVVGQSVLLFSGDAEVVNGCVKKPLESETWVDYCVLNDIDLSPIWNGFVQRTAEGSLSEVRQFFNR
jgi:hypothetical protein